MLRDRVNVHDGCLLLYEVNRAERISVSSDAHVNID